MEPGKTEIEECYRRFGKTARRHRLKKKLPQTKVAKRLGLSRVSLVNIEQGRQRIMLGEAIELANLLEFSLHDIQKEFADEQLSRKVSEQPANVRAALEALLSKMDTI